MSLYLNNFPLNCGAYVVSNFVDWCSNRKTEEDKLDELAEIDKSANYSTLFASVNNSQKAWVEPVLLEAGFTKIIDGVFNPNHPHAGHYITFYCKEGDPSKNRLSAKTVEYVKQSQERNKICEEKEIVARLERERLRAEAAAKAAEQRRLLRREAEESERERRNARRREIYRLKKEGRWHNTYW